MKKMYSNYEVELTTLSPLFIGSGEKLTKKEYIINEYDHSIRIPNMPKLYKLLIENNLDDKYNEFVLSKDQKNLYNFLKENSVKDFKRFIKYSFDVSKLRNFDQNVGIECFVKDAFQKLYIPASSLKGAIRTAFINYDILENIDKKNEYNSLKYKISDQVYSLEEDRKSKIHTKNVENEALVVTVSDEQEEDIFKYLSISDSEPIGFENVIGAPKIDIPYKTDRQKRKGNTINTMKESIKPGVNIKLNLRIEDNPFYNIETIEKAIRRTYDIYYENFVSKFNDFIKEKDNNIIYIGGNVGFSNKTLINGLFYKKNNNEDVTDISRRILESKFPRAHHKNDKYVSPGMIKATSYDGKLYEFGKCGINFREI